MASLTVSADLVSFSEDIVPTTWAGGSFVRFQVASEQVQRRTRASRNPELLGLGITRVRPRSDLIGAAEHHPTRVIS